MKKTAQKLLLALYPTDTKAVWLDYDVLSFLTPEITAAGRRSLVAQVQKKSLVHVEHLQRTKFRITQQGQHEIQAYFPALLGKEGWQGEWTFILFLSAPQQDPSFRYLRTLLLQRGAVIITRGGYVYPGLLPQEVLSLCQELYRDEVVITLLGKMIQGDIMALISHTYSLSDMFQTYSGISRETSSLIRRKQPLSELNNQQKDLIYTAFDRFFTALEQDPGILRYYYPDSPDPLSILNDFQDLLGIL